MLTINCSIFTISEMIVECKELAISKYMRDGVTIYKDLELS